MSDSVTTQAIGLANTLFDDLLTGKQRRTIRLGEKDFEPGFLMYQGSQDPSVTAFVWITDVLHIKLKGAAIKTGETLEFLIEELSPYYPAQVINGETRVTLILHLTPEATTKIFPRES